MYIQYIFPLYLLAVNTAAFICFGIDKRRAKREKWRLRERTLILLSAVGGSVGALLAMKIFHHKTRHKKFTLGIPVILILQAAAAVMIFLHTKGYV